ncbi:hypothetical protein GC167_01990 [bacterium]|nr:hypothetical protein [bacterium]
MRILGRIPHAVFHIVVYETERHYYVEIEVGPMKQCFKFPKESVAGIPGIQALLDDEFERGLEARFDQMYTEMKRVLERKA